MTVFARSTCPALVQPADRPEDFLAIRAPDCAAVVWRRQADPGFAAWIAAAEPDTLPQGRVTAPLSAVAEVLGQMAEVSGLAPVAGATMLVGDIAALAVAFGGAVDSGTVRLRLQVVHDDACRRFHTNVVPARMLCTYRGPGTEYGLAAPGQTPDLIQRLGPCDAGLFKGSGWPGAREPALLHRSPPMAGGWRYLAVIDLPWDDGHP